MRDLELGFWKSCRTLLWWMAVPRISENTILRASKASATFLVKSGN